MSWVPLEPSRWGLLPGSRYAAGVVAFTTIFGAQFGRGLTGDDLAGGRGWAWWAVGAVVGFVVGVLILVLVHRIRHPPSSVDLDRGLLRIGRREIPFAEVTWAKVLVDARTKRSRPLTIEIGPASGGSVAVVLRDARGRVAGEVVRDRLGAVIAGSSIVMPFTSKDPTGRFARFNFPTNVDREAALAVVAQPPGLGDPLPISDRFPPA